jgi:hypothetical protein
LAIVFFVSGLYDAFGGFYFAFSVGTGCSVDNPPTHIFYAIFIASFLFSFVYLQILSSFNIQRYLCNVGVVIFGRFFYVVLLFSYISSVPDFPTTFLPTGIIDFMWSVIYIVVALLSEGVRFRDLFLPKRILIYI